MSDPSDEALLAAHLRGDPAAFGQLVARHERRIYGLCLRILGNREDAEDATQEAFLAALRKAASFRRAAAFSTWLYRIAVNAATDQAPAFFEIKAIEERLVKWPPGGGPKIHVPVDLFLRRLLFGFKPATAGSS